MPKPIPTLILLGLLFAPGLVLAQSATISLSPARGTYQVQDTVLVTVLLDAPDPVTSIRANVNYDAQRLVFRRVNTTNSAFVHWWDNASLSSQSAGQVKLQASSPAPGITGTNLHVATIEFQATGNGVAGILLDPNSLVLNSADENILVASQVPGGIFSIGTITPSLLSTSFTRDLQVGSQGPDVKALQQYLNQQGFPLAATGAGSPEQESEYFGPRTRDALIRFQETHASRILQPLGLTTGTGYFGPSTRLFISQGL